MRRCPDDFGITYDQCGSVRLGVVIHNNVANFGIEVRVIGRLVFIVLKKINMIVTKIKKLFQHHRFEIKTF